MKKSESDFNESVAHCAAANSDPIEVFKVLDGKGISLKLHFQKIKKIQKFTPKGLNFFGKKLQF